MNRPSDSKPKPEHACNDAEPSIRVQSAASQVTPASQDDLMSNAPDLMAFRSDFSRDVSMSSSHTGKPMELNSEIRARVLTEVEVFGPAGRERWGTPSPLYPSLQEARPSSPPPPRPAGLLTRLFRRVRAWFR